MRLLDLRAAAAAVGRAPSPASADAAQAIAAPLAAWRLGDGGLATFGGGEGDPWTVDLALAASGWRGRAPLDMPRCRIYARSLAGRAILAADRFGALEFSHGADRLFTSIGAQSDAPAKPLRSPRRLRIFRPFKRAGQADRRRPHPARARRWCHAVDLPVALPKARRALGAAAYTFPQTAKTCAAKMQPSPPLKARQCSRSICTQAQDAIALDDGGILIRVALRPRLAVPL